RATLLEDFTLASPLSHSAQSMIARMQGAGASVSVHIRRGDYVANQKVAASYGPCTEAYYNRAAKEIVERTGSPTWFVFSDDIDWVKDTLTFPGTVIYVSGEAANDQEELLLMAACAHNVIANSSFSWWGAWLNQNPEKIVVAPSPWFDTRQKDHKDLLPSSWTLIPKK
ncbi:MAG: glycosyl transferase family 11, partial [Parcubacteria group bacterium]|nr:glycosyl transferase family 11 [Parcubacteria group bacterium]